MGVGCQGLAPDPSKCGQLCPTTPLPPKPDLRVEQADDIIGERRGGGGGRGAGREGEEEKQLEEEDHFAHCSDRTSPKGEGAREWEAAV